MNKYIVELRGGLLRKEIIVHAHTFNKDIFGGSITFVDKEGNNIALFKDIEVKNIRLINTKVEL